MDTPKPRPLTSGFVTRAAAEAGRDIEDRLAAVEAALPLDDLREASGAEAEAGAAFLFSHTDPEGWGVEGAISRGPSGLMVSRLEVLPGPLSTAPNGVTTRILQRIPIEKILASVRAHAALEDAQREGTRKILGEEPAPGIFSAGDANLEKPGRKNAITDELLRQVAVVYLSETAAGKPPGALQRMAEQFDRPEKTVQGWIARARKAGWLGPGARGRTGAEPGPRLLGWAGETYAESTPLRKEAQRLAVALGASSRGQVKNGLSAYDDPAERALANDLGVHPLVASLAAEIAWGHSLGAELNRRLDAASAKDVAARPRALADMRHDLEPLYAGKGLTVTLDEPEAE